MDVVFAVVDHEISDDELVVSAADRYDNVGVTIADFGDDGNYFDSIGSTDFVSWVEFRSSY